MWPFGPILLLACVSADGSDFLPGIEVWLLCKMWGRGFGLEAALWLAAIGLQAELKVCREKEEVCVCAAAERDTNGSAGTWKLL